MATIQIPNGWQPRPYQKAAWTYLENGGKRANLVWHRRAGKDDLCLNWAAVAAHERIGSYWHMLPEASQARKAIWDAINPHTGKRRIDEAFPKEIRATTREQDMMIKFKSGSTWQVVGSDNYDSLVGSPPVGVVFSEWALANPSAWPYISPILRENGGWALFITTPRGRNHAKSMYDMAKGSEDWFAQLLTVNETNVFSPAMLEAEKSELIATYGEDEGISRFRQEYHCDFSAALIGSYYGKEMNKAEAEGRITRVPYDPSKPVYAVFDLGHGDKTAIWFVQDFNGQLRAIDYHESSGKSIPFYAQLLKDSGYHIAKIILPHDGGHGRLSTGVSYQQQFKDLGYKVDVLPVDSIDAGIQVARVLIGIAVFDEAKCAVGLECLRNYQRKWDDVRKVFNPTPLHNWASDGADSWRYVAMARSAGKFVVEETVEAEVQDDYRPSEGAWMG